MEYKEKIRFIPATVTIGTPPKDQLQQELQYSDAAQLEKANNYALENIRWGGGVGLVSTNDQNCKSITFDDNLYIKMVPGWH